MTIEIVSPFEQSPDSETGTRCVLIDPVADAQLIRWIYELAPQGAPQWMPLFTGTGYASLTDVSPALVLSGERGDWAGYASALLEQSHAGCVLYLEDRSQWTDAVKHCQSLLTIRTKEKSVQLMRFFEPRWLEPLIASLTPDELQAFLGPFSGLAWRNELGWRYQSRLQPWDGVVHKPGWLHIGRARQQAMRQKRLEVIATELAKDYSAVLKMPAPQRFVYDQLCLAQTAGVEQKAHFERWIRLALHSQDRSWPTAEARQILARDDLVVAGKLDALERLEG
ncbi:DUF4123 domain-containing protein [Pseudomonas sp. NyZ704]|nr:DUF4123 domain-containing protein [Pseudomonas sp. NyZ704]